MPVSKHRRKGSERKVPGFPTPRCAFSPKGLIVAGLLAERFGTVRPTAEDMAVFIAETPLLRGCDSETGLVLWAIAIEAVKRENSALLVELDASATTQT